MANDSQPESKVTERPLMTYLLLSFNQERFIREAVAGAFAQTYSPLEIILSDDCSSDGTFDIMSAMAASYAGPHKIILNRNERNLGIGAHMNWALAAAGGELIVGAAGDDISMPARTERVFTEWVRMGRGICSIYSDAVIIDEGGRELGALVGRRTGSHAGTIEEAIARGGVGVCGCSHVYSKRTFGLFGAMDGRICAEDAVIAFRNLLLGKIGYIEEPLVYYRSHGGNVSMRSSGRPSLETRRREKENHEVVLLTWLYDLNRARTSGLLADEEAERYLTALYDQLRLVNVERLFYNQPLVSGILYLARQLFGYSNLRQAVKMVERRLRCAAKTS